MTRIAWPAAASPTATAPFLLLLADLSAGHKILNARDLGIDIRERLQAGAGGRGRRIGHRSARIGDLAPDPRSGHLADIAPPRAGSLPLRRGCIVGNGGANLLDALAEC